VGCLTRNKPFGFGVDPYRDPDPGILTEFLPLQDTGSEFCAISCALLLLLGLLLLRLAEVCDLRASASVMCQKRPSPLFFE